MLDFEQSNMQTTEAGSLHDTFNFLSPDVRDLGCQRRKNNKSCKLISLECQISCPILMNNQARAGKKALAYISIETLADSCDTVILFFSPKHRYHSEV